MAWACGHNMAHDGPWPMGMAMAIAMAMSVAMVMAMSLAMAMAMAMAIWACGHHGPGVPWGTWGALGGQGLEFAMSLPCHCHVHVIG